MLAHTWINSIPVLQRFVSDYIWPVADGSSFLLMFDFSVGVLSACVVVWLSEYAAGDSGWRRKIKPRRFWSQWEQCKSCHPYELQIFVRSPTSFECPSLVGVEDLWSGSFRVNTKSMFCKLLRTEMFMSKRRLGIVRKRIIASSVWTAIRGAIRIVNDGGCDNHRRVGWGR